MPQRNPLLPHRQPLTSGPERKQEDFEGPYWQLFRGLNLLDVDRGHDLAEHHARCAGSRQTASQSGASALEGRA